MRFARGVEKVSQNRKAFFSERTLCHPWLCVPSSRPPRPPQCMYWTTTSLQVLVSSPDASLTNASRELELAPHPRVGRPLGPAKASIHPCIRCSPRISAFCFGLATSQAVCIFIVDFSLPCQVSFLRSSCQCSCKNCVTITWTCWCPIPPVPPSCSCFPTAGCFFYFQT